MSKSIITACLQGRKIRSCFYGHCLFYSWGVDGKKNPRTFFFKLHQELSSSIAVVNQTGRWHKTKLEPGTTLLTLLNCLPGQSSQITEQPRRRWQPTYRLRVCCLYRSVSEGWKGNWSALKRHPLSSRSTADHYRLQGNRATSSTCCFKFRAEPMTSSKDCTCGAHARLPFLFLAPTSECELSRCLKTRHCGQSHRKPRRQRTSHPVCVLEEALPPQMRLKKLLNLSHVKWLTRKYVNKITKQ